MPWRIGSVLTVVFATRSCYNKLFIGGLLKKVYIHLKFIFWLDSNFRGAWRCYSLISFNLRQNRRLRKWLRYIILSLHRKLQYFYVIACEFDIVRFFYHFCYSSTSTHNRRSSFFRFFLAVILLVLIQNVQTLFNHLKAEKQRKMIRGFCSPSPDCCPVDKISKSAVLPCFDEYFQKNVSEMFPFSLFFYQGNLS